MMSKPGVAYWRSRLRTAIHAGERRAAQTPFLFSLLAVFVLLAIAVAAFQPSYETNDDVFMTMIVSGQGFCPAPDEHLVFSNVIIGHALKRLYTAWPNLPWYGCYLLFVHYWAQVAILYCALTADSEGGTKVARPRLVLYLVYFFLVELPLLSYLQFTSTAFLAAVGGILLLLLAMRRTCQWDTVALPRAMAVLLLLVAGLIRFESLAVALLLAAPLGLLFARQATRRTLAAAGMAAAVAAMLLTVTTAYNRMSYEHDPRWNGFFSYNQLRVKFNDYCWTSYSPQTAAVFSAVGWSKNDHEMIARWFFDDPVVYSEAHLRAIVEAYPWKSERSTTGYYWQVCRGLLRDRAVWAVFLALPFFLASVDRARHARWTVIGCTIMAVGLVVFLTWNNKVLPTRVYFPILSFPLAVALLFPARSTKVSTLLFAREPKGEGRIFHALIRWRAQPPWTRVVVVCLLVGIVMGGFRHCRRSMLVHRDRCALQAFLVDLRPQSRKLYVCWGATMPFEMISPFDSLASWSHISLLNLVWTQRTPWQEEIKRRFGISNLAQAMYERDDIILVAAQTDRALFTTFAKEHFGTEVEFVPSSSTSEKLVAGRFQRRTPHAETASNRTDQMER